MLTVYLDLVMGLNFLVDFLILLGTNRLSGHPAQPGRCALAAALGAVYGGVCLLPGFHFLGGWLWRLVFLALMGAAAFGLSLARCAMFVLLSMALGGISLSLGRSDWVMPLLCVSCLYLLCVLCFPNGAGGREYVRVTAARGDRQVTALALRDTGNTLRDPVTGGQVLVLSADAARTLTGLTMEQLRHPVETMVSPPVPGLRLIPYRSVGGAGLLLGLGLEDVVIDGRKRPAVVAFAPEGLGKGEALAGGYV